MILAEGWEKFRVLVEGCDETTLEILRASFYTGAMVSQYSGARHSESVRALLDAELDAYINDIDGRMAH